MERRDNGKINFCELARSLGISPMTICRVVNNVPCVRRETRARVADALNRHGCCTHTPRKDIRVLFDFAGHPCLTHYGQVLMSNVSRLNYTCFVADHRKNAPHFFDTAGECFVIITLLSAGVTLSFGNMRGGNIDDEERLVHPASIEVRPVITGSVEKINDRKR